MEKNKRKEYEKPKVTRVDLDAKCAVLGFCRADTKVGIALPNCGGAGSPCSSMGS